MTDEKPKVSEMTEEQKAAMEMVKNSVSKFNQAVSFYLFNQLQMIEEGEIHIHLVVKDRQIGKLELSSHLARDLTNGKKD